MCIRVAFCGVVGHVEHASPEGFVAEQDTGACHLTAQTKVPKVAAILSGEQFGGAVAVDPVAKRAVIIRLGVEAQRERTKRGSGPRLAGLVCRQEIADMLPSELRRGKGK